jgi:hypothetical protein
MKLLFFKEKRFTNIQCNFNENKIKQKSQEPKSLLHKSYHIENGGFRQKKMPPLFEI